MREFLGAAGIFAALIVVEAMLPKDDDEDTLPRCPDFIPDWMLEESA